MSLYLAKTGDRRLWVAYIDDEDEYGRIFVYVANTGRFHRNEGVEADFYWDNDHQYQPIDATEARVLMSEGVGKLDERKKTGLLTRFREDPTALAPADVLGDDAAEEPYLDA